jgi:hypothetical protein
MSGKRNVDTTNDEGDQRLLAAMVQRMINFPRQFRSIRDDDRVGLYAAWGADVAAFVRDVALEARAFELVGAAETALRAADAILAEDVRLDEQDRRETEDAERREAQQRAAAHWQRQPWMSTDDMVACLYPRWLAVSDVFRVLKELEYVDWVGGKYVPSRKALDDGLGEPDPGHPLQYVHWSKKMFEIVQSAFDDREKQKAAPENLDEDEV